MFDKRNTEVFVLYLGLQDEEYRSLQRLLQSYACLYGEEGRRFTVIDYSSAVNREIEELCGSSDNRVFKIHPRFKVTVPQQEVDEVRVGYYLKEMQDEYEWLQVIRPEERLFHSEGLNRIISEWAEEEFVLVLDSDVEFIKSNYFQDIEEEFSAQGCSELAAIGMFKHGWVKERCVSQDVRSRGIIRKVWRRVSRKRAVAADVKRLDRSQWYGTFPRLHPGLLLLNRKLLLDTGVVFRLLFLSVVRTEGGVVVENKMMGDCGASIVLFAALHGLKIGEINPHKWVRHSCGGSWKGLVEGSSTKGDWLFSQ